MKQKIAFLYLNTGAGHITPAKALAKGLESKYPETTEPLLLNGFSDKMKISRSVFENGYQLSTNYLESAYVLFYRLTEFPVMIRFGNYFISLNGVKHLADFFRNEGITKVVCLHEMLIIMARDALNRVNPSIPLITLVTDPFTAHALWFYIKKMELVVFSEKLRQEAIQKYGYEPSRVHTFPFMLSKKFEHRYSDEEISDARDRIGIPPGKKVVLIAGGGEGLKNADHIVAHLSPESGMRYSLSYAGRTSF
jgi:UDP-N-acetylglucosamine:LPS N-acetylglucosamine transferase